MKNIRIIQDFNLQGKRVIVRADLNVPIVKNKIIDNSRIAKIIPTIKYLKSQQAKIIIISHFSRPNGQFNQEMSLTGVALELAKLLEEKVLFCEELISEKAINTISSMKETEVILMENLRFYQEEEDNNQGFAANLAKLGDFYVNDAFSCSHREHASIVSLAKILPSAAGLLLQDELFNLEKILSKPKSPFAAIIGGAKISTKINLLYNLVKKTSLLAVGGAMANNFFKALNYNIGKSLYEPEKVAMARDLMKEAQENNCELFLPSDVVISTSIHDPKCYVSSIFAVKENMMILDLGPKTIETLSAKLSDINTLVWNGPLGAFEHKPFDIGTTSLARNISVLCNQGQLVTVAGGGDIVAALTSANLLNNFSYISTAGGAFLEWLESGDLCGVKVLRN